MLDFVIIGAQKAASTFLQRAIQQHPETFLPYGETPFFQDPDYNRDDLGPLQHAVAGAAPGQLKGIKRPNYLGQPEVPARIALHFPRIRLIAVLREPVSRAVSAYFHYMASGFLPILPIEEGMPRLLDGTMDRRWAVAEAVLDYGRYATHLKRYFQYFDREQMLIILQEHLRDRPVQTMQRVYAFLDLSDALFVPKNTDQRPMATITSLPRLRLLRALSPLTTRFNVDRTRKYRHRSLAARTLRKVIHGVDHYLLARVLPGRRPTLSPTLHQRLRDYYAEEVSQLRELVDDPLTGW